MATLDLTTATDGTEIAVLGLTKVLSLGTVTESESAPNINIVTGGNIAVNLGPASDTEVAPALSITSGGNVVVSLIPATDELDVNIISVTKGVSLTPATATETATALSIVIGGSTAVSLLPATTTETAQPLTIVPAGTGGGSSSTFTLLNLIAPSGYVRATWTSAGQPANFYSWRLYQRRVGDARWQRIFETRTVSTSYLHDSYAWANGVVQEMTLVWVTQNPTTGALTEGSYAGAIQFSYAGDASYWLVHPTNPALTVNFAIVTTDSFSPGLEHQVIELLDLNGEGGGRKINVGNYLGRSGTLHATIHDHVTLGTATAQRIKLEALHAAAVQVWLRTPFGDLTPVFIDSLGSFDRVAGVGVMESVEVDVSYVTVDGGSTG